MPAGPRPVLLERIRSEIRASGPLTFARFMELALYEPEAGYYAGGARRLGTAGDFFTASDLGPAFGRAIARQLAEIERAVGGLARMHVIEFGAGRGLLARDVLDALCQRDPDLARRVDYVAVDRSRAMREAAARLVPESRCVAPASLEPAAAGCVLAVELFDSLPVHRVRRRGGELVELLVDLDDAGGLVEREGEPRPEVAAWAERYGAAAREGTEAEVALMLAPQLERMARAVERGVLLIVDYGERAPRLYARPRGTLLAYRGHATSERYLEHVGEQDLTAHVNFSALEDCARELGLAVLGLTTQDRFLIANGLLEEFEQRDLTEARDPRRVRRRLQALQLLHPSGMGRAFKVLALSRGCDPPPRLSGLRDPFASGPS